jgi:hypothetical protein
MVRDAALGLLAGTFNPNENGVFSSSAAFGLFGRMAGR